MPKSFDYGINLFGSQISFGADPMTRHGSRCKMLSARENGTSLLRNRSRNGRPNFLNDIFFFLLNKPLYSSEMKIITGVTEDTTYSSVSFGPETTKSRPFGKHISSQIILPGNSTEID